jgi:hypothetical protein
MDLDMNPGEFQITFRQGTLADCKPFPVIWD